MRIGIDLDDVLADSMEQLLIFYNQTYKTNYQKSDFYTYRWSEIWGGTPQEATDKVFDFFASPYRSQIAPIKDSIQVVSQLAKEHELFIITSRQREFSDLTHAWIKQYFPTQFTEIIITNHPTFARSGKKKTKREVCLEKQIELLIEDSIEYAQECACPQTKVLLFDSPWNQGEIPSHTTRVRSWKEIEKLLSQSRKRIE